MPKLLSILACLIFLLSASASYAANGKPACVEKADTKKLACKTSERLIPEKLLRVKPLDLRASEKPNTSSSKGPSAANTFETLITPFLKAVAPHFYDQIIKKEPRPSTAQS